MNQAPFRLRLSPFSDVLSLLFSFVMIFVVLYLCYMFSKYAAKKMANMSQSNNIRILERVALGQDKGLLIAEICGKIYLIAFSNNKIEILKELDRDELHLLQPTNVKQDFLKVLNDTLKGRLEGKKNDETGSRDCDASEKNHPKKH